MDTLAVLSHKLQTGQVTSEQLVAGALDPLPVVGPYLTSILGNLSTIANAGAVAVIVMVFWDRVTE